MTKGDIQISFIIVTWNNEDCIKACIESLVQYCPYEREIIIVDNASEDETCRVIRDLNIERLILVRQEANLGFSMANNIGLERASGTYAFFVNPDVVFVEDIVTPMLRTLCIRKDVGVVSPRLVNSDGSFQPSFANFPSTAKVIWDDWHMCIFLSAQKRMQLAQAQYCGEENRYVDWTYGAAQLCAMKDVRRLGGYPDEYFMYGEDTEFCKMFSENLKKRTYYLGSSKLIHLGGYSEQQVTDSKKAEYVANASMRFVEKHNGKNALRRYRIVFLGASFVKAVVYAFFSVIIPSQENINSRIKWSTSWKTVLKYKIKRKTIF